MSKEYDDALMTLGGILRTPQELLPLEEEARGASTALASQMEKANAESTGIRWGWSADKNPDRWMGAFHTREAAIEDARNHGWKTFFVCWGACPDPTGYMPEADAIIDMIGEAASDAAGDAAEDFPDVTPEAIAELDKLLNEWSKKYLTSCGFWIGGEGASELIVPDAPVVKEPA